MYYVAFFSLEKLGSKSFFIAALVLRALLIRENESLRKQATDIGR